MHGTREGVWRADEFEVGARELEETKFSSFPIADFRVSHLTEVSPPSRLDGRAFSHTLISFPNSALATSNASGAICIA